MALSRSPAGMAVGLGIGVAVAVGWPVDVAVGACVAWVAGAFLWNGPNCRSTPLPRTTPIRMMAATTESPTTMLRLRRPAGAGPSSLGGLAGGLWSSMAMVGKI